MPYTGGPLNILNGKMAISAPQNSVPVMKLIRVHQPKSKQELVDLIKRHHQHDCDCGVKSQGSVYDFGKNLYRAQLKYWGEYRYTMQECIQWEYDLFIVQSLKGNSLEKRAADMLARRLPHFSIAEAEGYLDEELRIDIIVKWKKDDLCGVQVKPASFVKMRSEVIAFNRAANEKWGAPVFYLFYDDHDEFVNLHDIVEAIKQMQARIKRRQQEQ